MSTLDDTATEEKVRAQIARIKANLANSSLETWQSIEADLASALGEAIESGTDNANLVWFLQKAAKAHLSYLECFNLILRQDYYQAWCGLERIEIEISSLRRNQFYSLDEFGIDKLERTISRWQSIYPYAVFFSPEYISKEVRCSICNAIVDPWSNCTHKVGQVYSGVEACRVVHKVELISVSIVTDPVQKYSVAFIASADGSTKDQYDYSVLKFVAERLRSPLDGWSCEWTQAYHPHSLFQASKPTDGCPCGSGRLYSDCCLNKPGVRRPHLMIDFEQAPPASLPNTYLAGYGDQNGQGQVK